MTAKILITGAPGNVGTEVVRTLQNKADLRIAAYDTDQAKKFLGEDLDTVHFDFLDPSTFASAFADVDRMFLMRPPALSNVQRDIAPALRAAKDAGVRYIVFLSLQGVENNRVVPHYKIEKLIEELAIPHTFLRASFFMQNLSTVHRSEIQKEDQIAVPVGHAKTSFIDVRDIGAVAGRLLLEPELDHTAYTLTGPEALNYAQVSDILSRVLGRSIRYNSPSLPAFIMRQMREGRKFGYALVMAALYTITRFGNASDVTQDVRSILHRDPISFRQFASDYQEVWAKPT